MIHLPEPRIFLLVWAYDNFRLFNKTCNDPSSPDLLPLPPPCQGANGAGLLLLEREPDDHPCPVENLCVWRVPIAHQFVLSFLLPGPVKERSSVVSV